MSSHARRCSRFVRKSVRSTIAAVMEAIEPRLLLAGDRTTFAVIGDFGDDSVPERDVASLIKSWRAEFIITTGDNNYPFGHPDTIDRTIGKYYHEYIKGYHGLYGAGSEENRFWPSLGNHDWFTPAQLPGLPIAHLDFFDLPGNERYYDFVRGPVHFFAVDSDPAEPDGIAPDSPQGKWLRQKLAESTSPWNIVYMHHPPYGSGYHTSQEWMQWPYAEWGADVVLAGHEHLYERILNPSDGLPYIISGLGGRLSRYPFTTSVAGDRVQYNSDWGALRVDATGERLDFHFVTRFGTVIDTYSLAAGEAPPATPTNLRLQALSSSQVKLTWDDNSNDEGSFEIEYSADGQHFYRLAEVGADTTSFVAHALGGNDTYHFRVRAVNSAGRSGRSEAQTIVTPAGRAALVPFNSAWKYSESETEPPRGWNGRGFNDAGWSTGVTEIGFGDGDETTVLPAEEHAQSVYFRKTFTAANPAEFSTLVARLVRDDAAAVYINGFEVYRNNLLPHPVSIDTEAWDPIEGDDESHVYELRIPASLLSPGENVIAVEVHQAAPPHDDLSFNLELSDAGLAAAAPGNIAGTFVEENTVQVSWLPVSGATAYLVERSTDGVHFSPVATYTTSGPHLESGLPLETVFYYRVRALGPGGESLTATVSPRVPLIRPIAIIEPVNPDPTTLIPDRLTITFNQSVSGFGIEDLVLRRDGSANLLTAGQALTTSDNRTFVLRNLSSVLSVAGRYELLLRAEGSGITGVQNRPMEFDASESFRIQSGLDLVSASDTGLFNNDNVTRQSSPQVQGAAAAGATVIIRADGIEVGNGVAGADGRFDILVGPLADGLRLLQALTRNEQGQEQPLSIALPVWIDTFAPSSPTNLDLSPFADSGASNSDNITSHPQPLFTFTTDAPSIAFYLNDLLISDPLQRASGGHYTTPRLGPGLYRFNVRAVDLAGNESAPSAGLMVRVDQAGPGVDVLDVAPDPHFGPIDSILVRFSEPVAGFDAQDLSLLREDESVPLEEVLITPVDATTYSLRGLAAATARIGRYELMVDAAGVTDLFGNSGADVATERWTNIELTGTAGDDVINLAAMASGQHLSVQFNGEEYEVDLDHLPELHVTGNDGDDRLSLTGTTLPWTPRFVGGAGLNRFDIHGGTYTFAYDLGAAGSQVRLLTQGDATVTLAVNQHLDALLMKERASVFMAPGKHLLKARDLGLSDANLFDLADGAMILSNASLAAIRFHLLAGRNVAPGGTANAPWNGTRGIVSSVAAAAFAAGNVETRSIGYALNGQLPSIYQTFFGETVSPTDLLVRLTKNGDANLDGLVNNNDITILAGFYRPGTFGRHWHQADFNYDGFTDNNDITILAGFYRPNDTPAVASADSLPAARLFAPSSWTSAIARKRDSLLGEPDDVLAS